MFSSPHMHMNTSLLSVLLLKNLLLHQTDGKSGIVFLIQPNIEAQIDGVLF